MKLRMTEISAAAVLACAAGMASGQTYHVRDLGSLGGLGDTEAFALSRTGTNPIVVGFATRADHAHRGFVWANGVMQEVVPLAPDVFSIAYGVDAQGRAVGVMYQLGEAGSRAFRTGGAVLAGLGQFTARATNDAGEVAGYRTVMETIGLAGELTFDRACVYRGTPPVLTELGTMYGSHWSRAYAMNNHGLVVGCSGTANDAPGRAVVWVGTTAHDLGTFAGSPSGAGEACAYAVNDGGIAAGYCTGLADPDNRYAAAWWIDAAGNVTNRANLGALPAAPGKPVWSYAYGLNNSGAVVGQSNGRAFVFDHGVMKDLNSLTPPGWFIVTARAINDSGLIAAWGVNGVGEPRPLLLTPCVGDYNRDGRITVQDVFDFLAGYFADDPRADIDQSGNVSVQDIFDFLGHYFGGSC